VEGEGQEAGGGGRRWARRAWQVVRLNGVGVVGLDSLSGYPTEVIEMGLRFFVQMHVFIRFN
jgi:hypothetical protein